jgi:hypothetical protein
MGTKLKSDSTPDATRTNKNAKAKTQVTLRLVATLGMPTTPERGTCLLSMERSLSSFALALRGRRDSGSGSTRSPSLGGSTPSANLDVSDETGSFSRTGPWAAGSPNDRNGAFVGEGAGVAGGNGNGKPEVQAPSYPWPFSEALLSRQTVHVTTLSEGVTDTLERRGWGDVPREAVIVPFGGTGNEDDETSGWRLPKVLLVVGLNTRRPYDEEYRNWVGMVRVSLDSTLGAVLGRQADIQRAL